MAPPKIRKPTAPGATPAPQESGPATGASPAPPVAGAPPLRRPAAAAVMLEYQPLDAPEKWRVEKFDLLAAELGLADWVHALEADGEHVPAYPDLMAGFAFFCQAHARFWLLVRRLYGVAPVIPSPDATPDDLRVWTRAELEADGFQLQADTETLRKLWLDSVKRDQSVQSPKANVQSLPPVPRGELALDDRLLEQFQFSDRIFKIQVWDPQGGPENKGSEIPRPLTEMQAERAWFLGRVKEWAKMLGDPMGGPIARSALMNDLYLRRMEAEIATASPKQRGNLYEQKTALANEYNDAVEKLQEMFPEMAVAGKVTFRGVISDMLVAYRDYKNGDGRLVDRIWTAAEIEYQLRESQQVGPRYRFGLNLAIIDAINGLYDPHHRPRFKHSVLKKMDAVARAVVVAAREAQGEQVVDLENGVLPGEGDDFEDFNDAECPHCGGRISSQARRCPECRKQIVKI